MSLGPRRRRVAVIASATTTAVILAITAYAGHRLTEPERGIECPADRLPRLCRDAADSYVKGETALVRHSWGPLFLGMVPALAVSARLTVRAVGRWTAARARARDVSAVPPAPRVGGPAREAQFRLAPWEWLAGERLAGPRTGPGRFMRAVVGRKELAVLAVVAPLFVLVLVPIMQGPLRSIEAAVGMAALASGMGLAIAGVFWLGPGVVARLARRTREPVRYRILPGGLEESFPEDPGDLPTLHEWRTVLPLEDDGVLACMRTGKPGGPVLSFPKRPPVDEAFLRTVRERGRQG